MDIFPKFIVEEHKEMGLIIKIGKVTYHKDLAEDPKRVKGGGMWSIKDKQMEFSGTSFDFGAAKKEDIEICTSKGNVFAYKHLQDIKGIEEYKFYYIYPDGEKEELKRKDL